MIVNGKDFVNLLHDQTDRVSQLTESEREILNKKIQEFVKNQTITIDVPETIYNKIISGSQKNTTVREIIISIRDEQGWTPLHHAAHTGNLPKVKKLLKAGIDPNEKTHLNSTPLTLAYINDHFEVIKELIHFGAVDEINQKDEEGWTLLHYAASSGNLKEVKKLIQAGARLSELTNGGSTPLALALKGAHPKVVKELILNGADIKKVDLEGSTLFDILERKRRIDSKCSALFKELKKSYPELQAQNKESRRRTLLAHAWNLGGFSPLIKIEDESILSKVKLEGSYSSESFRIMAKHLLKFKTDYPEQISETLIDLLNDSLKFAANQDAISSEKTLQRIKQGLPTFIQSGYSGHAITLLIYKDRFLICNQGMLSRKPIEAYHFDQESLTTEVMEKIREAKIDLSNNRAEKYKKFCFEVLPNALKFTQNASDLELERVTPLPRQIVGNCAWVSPHIALCGLMLLSDQDLNGFNALHLSEQFYILETGLKNLTKDKSYFKMDHDLFETALHKAHLLPLDATSSKKLETITQQYLSSLGDIQKTQLKSSLQYWKTHPHDTSSVDLQFYARMKETIHENAQDLLSFFDELMSDLEKEEG